MSISVTSGTCSCHVVVINAPSSAHLQVPIRASAHWEWAYRPVLVDEPSVDLPGALFGVLLLLFYAECLEYLKLLQSSGCAQCED